VEGNEVMKAFRFRDKLVAGLFAIGFVVLGGTTPVARADDNFAPGDYRADAILIRRCALKTCIADGQGYTGDGIKAFCAVADGDSMTYDNKTSKVWVRHQNATHTTVSGYSSALYLRWDKPIPLYSGTTCNYS
jgi:hypothetical protein